MEISFDPKKDKLNQRKHGVSLDMAVAFEWHTALIWTDQRYQYTELRECALGLIGTRLYFLVFVEYRDVVRVISLRRATRQEERQYATQQR